MGLSQELLSQFAKLTNNENKVDSINVKGTYKKINGIEYVQLDGSDIWTPVTSTVEAETGERVTVTIKDHNATVTGNISSPSARTKSVQDLKDEVDEYGNTIKQLDNSIEQQGNSIIQIENNINQQQNTINQHGNLINQQNDKIISIGNDVIAQNNEIEALNNDITLQGNVIDSMNNTIIEHGNNINMMNNTISQQGNIISQQGNTITQQGNVINQHGNTINEVNSNITILNSGFTIQDGVITGLSGAVINDLKTNTLNAEYATITFSNIQMAAIQKLFTDSGIIKDLIVSQGKITGELVGVTIKGDLIEGNSIVADKLVVKGDDGLYYKLNIDGLNNISTSESGKFVLLQNEPDNWETNYKNYYVINNGNYIHISGNNPPTWALNTYYKLSSTYESALDGTNIVAQSVTADKIQVTDLVAFGATIGGFDINTHSLHTHSKNSIDSPVSGMFMDDSGQLVFGDGSNFIKYFKDTNNQWELVIRANQISMGSSSKTIQEEFNDLENSTVKNVDVLYALGDSQTQAPTTGWSTVAPAWQSGKYMWQKTVTTFGDNTTSESDPTCISGANGQDGQPGAPGAPGTNSYTHIRYSANSDGTNFVENPTTATKYIGICVTNSQTAPSNKTAYNWSKYIGENGQNGQNGQPGATGVGVNTITELYYLHTNNSTAPAKPTSHISDSTGGAGKWTIKCPTWSSGKYYWICSEVLYTNNTYKWTDPVLASGLNSANTTANIANTTANTANTTATTAKNTADAAKETADNMEVGVGNLLFNYQKPKADSTQWDSISEVITNNLPNTNDSTFALRGNLLSKYFVPYNKDKKYKISSWLKTMSESASSSTSYYPSIYPYDLDKNQIGYNNTLYLDNTVTTLSEDLKNGDTIIHATSLSNWENGKSNTNYYVGIFDYKASNGCLYDKYTRHVYKYANTNEALSSIVNKTNNTITLKSAYSGSTIPAGTKIATTKDGSTFIYPFGGITKSQTSNWTYKEKTFDSSFDRRLLSASYIKYAPTVWQTDIYVYNAKLLDVDTDFKAAEIVVGTQTAATGAWTGKASFSELSDGQQIVYWLPYAGSGNATLNLTLANGTTTGAINCYYSGASRITTHYAAGNAIHLTYRVNANVNGTNYTGWWADANYDSNNTDRVRYQSNIKCNASAKITSERLIVGKSDNLYYILVNDLSFDITKPILWAGSDIEVNATGNNNYIMYSYVNLANNISGISLTTNATVYAKGTLSGSTFTMKGFTTTVPTSDDGYYYILLGLMYNTTNCGLFPEHPIYKYVNGEFKSLNQVAYEARYEADQVRSDLAGEINGAKSELQKNINKLDESIDGKVKESIQNGAATQAVMDLINGSFEMKFSNSASAINKSIADLLSNRDTMVKYIQFKDGDIILGETDSEFSLKIENDQIGIYYGSMLLSHWDTKSFIVDLLQTMELRLKKEAWNYKFTFITNDNGSVSFRRVDGE